MSRCISQCNDNSGIFLLHIYSTADSFQQLRHWSMLTAYKWLLLPLLYATILEATLGFYVNMLVLLKWLWLSMGNKTKLQANDHPVWQEWLHSNLQCIKWFIWLIAEPLLLTPVWPSEAYRYSKAGQRLCYIANVALLRTLTGPYYLDTPYCLSNATTVLLQQLCSSLKRIRSIGSKLMQRVYFSFYPF